MFHFTNQVHCFTLCGQNNLKSAKGQLVFIAPIAAHTHTQNLIHWVKQKHKIDTGAKIFGTSMSQLLITLTAFRLTSLVALVTVLPFLA